ncbi:MAG: hypothetical protein QG590_1923, partial [Pseudomonadota bacterium]|nr:hypothetical protein [Pseudomonadota bacterium]
SAVPTESQRLLLFINADGTVDNVVFSFESEFALRAAERMRYWRFSPGVKDGRPVPSFKLLDIVLEASIGFEE